MESEKLYFKYVTVVYTVAAAYFMFLHANHKLHTQVVCQMGLH